MEEKKKFKLGLLPKLIIAIIVGILFGQFLPEASALCGNALVVLQPVPVVYHR